MVLCHTASQPLSFYISSPLTHDWCISVIVFSRNTNFRLLPWPPYSDVRSLSSVTRWADWRTILHRNTKCYTDIETDILQSHTQYDVTSYYHAPSNLPRLLALSAKIMLIWSSLSVVEFEAQLSSRVSAPVIHSAAWRKFLCSSWMKSTAFRTAYEMVRFLVKSIRRLADVGFLSPTLEAIASSCGKNAWEREMWTLLIRYCWVWPMTASTSCCNFFWTSG